MDAHANNLRSDARRNYDQLVQAAQAIFASQGPLAPLEIIAKQAGVGIGTLYRHFPSRKALLETIYGGTIAELDQKARALMTAASPETALTTWLQQAARYGSAAGGFGHFMTLTTEDANSPLVSAGTKLLRRAQQEGSLRNDVTMVEIFHLLNGIIAPVPSDAELARTQKLLSVILAGLKKPAAGSDRSGN